MRLGVLPFAVGSAFADLIGSWRAAEDVGFDALWTVDHTTPTADFRPAWETSSLLVALRLGHERFLSVSWTSTFFSVTRFTSQVPSPWPKL